MSCGTSWNVIEAGTDQCCHGNLFQSGSNDVQLVVEGVGAWGRIWWNMLVSKSGVGIGWNQLWNYVELLFAIVGTTSKKLLVTQFDVQL